MTNNTDTSNPQPDSNMMSLPYAEQMQPLASRLLEFASNRSTHFVTSHDLSGDWPEHSKTENVYTRAQVTEALKRFIHLAGDTAKYASHLPTKTKINKAGIIAALQETYTVTRGANKGNVRNLVMNALGSARRNARFAKRAADNQAEIAGAVASGGAFFAAGVTDKEGNPRPYGTEIKAQKAYCREVHGGDWWAADKANRLAEAAKHVTRGVSAPATGPTSSVDYMDMAAIKVIGIAKRAGAPTDVTSGKGAKARSVNWLIDNAI